MHFVKQTMIEGIAKAYNQPPDPAMLPGDSGSPWVYRSGNDICLVAQGFAGNSDGRFGVISSIIDILKGLRIKLLFELF